MRPEEYENLRRIDEDHWFYRGKRDIVRYWIERFLDLKSDDLLIDGGMGTGTWAVEMASRCRVIGLDDHEESLALASPRLKAAGGQAMLSGVNRVDLPSGAAAVVTLLDVLEHVEDDAGAMGEMIRLVRPGGLIIVTVPALQALWSDWDETLHHLRRYTRGGLVRVLEQPGVRLLRCAYFNTALLLPIALVRWYRRLRPAVNGKNRSEDWTPPALINRALHYLLVRPACSDFWPAPLGVSLLGVLRRVQD
ncbi:MAG: methyltransferase domain-containing protein [Thermodesulfobacteriota bacterium]